MLKNTLNALKPGILFVLFTFFSCKTASSVQVKTANSQDLTVISKDLKWSDKMALTLMKRHPEAYMIDDSKAPKWDYVHGLVLHGFEELYKRNPDPRYASYIKGYADILVESDGTIKTYEIEKYNIDMIVAGRLLFNLYDTTKDNRYLIAMQTLKKQLENHPRTQSGGFWHKKIYPNQMWLDGLYMGEPFYAEYTATFENGKNLDDVAKQFEQIQLHATDPKTGLLYHGWDESKQMPWADKETGNSPNYWSRALGWYVMALVDALDYFPKDHPKQKELVGYLNNVSESLAKYQDKSGLWYQVTDKMGKEGNYLEASGSSMFAYAFAKGANKGYLPSKFKKLANKAFDGLTTQLMKVDADGSITLTQACQVAGLGGTPYRDGSYEYYVNEKKKDNDPKATGPFILAALELNR
ncbi:glycoside hydrolase family 88/105 protein [Flavobacterium sp. CF136]|uniref:glycoside hydrolase family 88/105 protein n=1 Tax=Flavobacterium sp. (strain CF136) TaxID=1144313 RepID=UPI0002715B74|nr:glycoside hydrolase family 88 protein [Flavobacterium sp. CF136]EJL60893.1 putative unsaturated glucuronyl hydrolase [Flavobacterium sp. CF136]